MNDNLLFIYTHPSSFVKGDISILEENFKVSKYHFVNNPKSKLPISLLRQLLFLIFNIHKFRIIYIWFADYHSLLPILFAKLFGRKSCLVIGGYDICREKKYNYGSLCKPLRAFMSVTSIKQATLVLAVSENVVRTLNSIAPTANTILIYNGIPIPDTNTPITNNNILNSTSQTNTSLNHKSSPEHNTSQKINTSNYNTNTSTEQNTSQNINSPNNNLSTSTEQNTSQYINTPNNNLSTSPEQNTLSYYTTLERDDNDTPTRSVLCVALVNTVQTFYIKGIDRLNKIAHELTDTPFILIGCREEIFALAKTAPAPNLKIIPPVPQGQLLSYYKQCHVYCQPSRRESFSLSLAEAMFHNMIPVVSTAGGMPEVVQQHGYTIYMNDSPTIQESSIKQMTSAITKALSQHKNPQYKEHIIKHFSLHIRKEKIFNAFKADNSL